MESVQKNSQIESRFEPLESSNGKYYFNLKASNGQIIGTSEMYETASGRDGGMASVSSNAPVATVEEDLV